MKKIKWIDFIRMIYNFDTFLINHSSLDTKYIYYELPSTNSIELYTMYKYKIKIGTYVNIMYII